MSRGEPLDQTAITGPIQEIRGTIGIGLARAIVDKYLSGDTQYGRRRNCLFIMYSLSRLILGEEEPIHEEVGGHELFSNEKTSLEFR